MRSPALRASQKAYWKDLIERHYHLAVRSVGLVWQGANITLKIDTGPDSFYLRLYREKGRSRAEIDAEIGALLTFRPAGQVYVSTPVQTRGGDHVFSCDHEQRRRWAALFTAAPGSLPEGDAASLSRLGEAVGVLHEQMAPASPVGRPFDPARTVSRTVETIASLGPGLRAADRGIAEAGAASIAELDACGALRVGFCHGDVWLGKNVHFLGQRVTFFDFDECVDGPLSVDLMTPIMGLWYAGLVDFPAQSRVFLDAYAAVRPLPANDIMAIPPLARLYEIGLLGFLAGSGTLEPYDWEMALDYFERRMEEWRPGGAAATAIYELATLVGLDRP
ncbi:MAG: phosphotransferase [Rhodomicrobiaceae bacterium]